jgi:hypothetical protein
MTGLVWIICAQARTTPAGTGLTSISLLYGVLRYIILRCIDSCSFISICYCNLNTVWMWADLATQNWPAATLTNGCDQDLGFRIDSSFTYSSFRLTCQPSNANFASAKTSPTCANEYDNSRNMNTSLTYSRRLLWHWLHRKVPNLCQSTYWLG